MISSSHCHKKMSRYNWFHIAKEARTRIVDKGWRCDQSSRN